MGVLADLKILAFLNTYHTTGFGYVLVNIGRLEDVEMGKGGMRAWGGLMESRRKPFLVAYYLHPSILYPVSRNPSRPIQSHQTYDRDALRVSIHKEVPRCNCFSASGATRRAQGGGATPRCTQRLLHPAATTRSRSGTREEMTGPALMCLGRVAAQVRKRYEALKVRRFFPPLKCRCHQSSWHG